jgi:hypothetical protein
MESKVFRRDGNVITVDFTGSLSMAEFSASQAWIEFEAWLDARYKAQSLPTFREASVPAWSTHDPESEEPSEDEIEYYEFRQGDPS